MRLTIAIPTYNRNDYLVRNLGGLLQQITPECSLLIVDNHSDVPVDQSLSALLADYPGVDVRIIRHGENVGGGQNILRCVESCTTEWIWILGDDDEVVPHAVSTVLRDIDRHPDFVHLNYCSPHFSRSETFETCGTDEYVSRLDSFSNALFMSVNVYNRAAIAPQLRFGYLYAYSWAPHFATMLVSLGEGGKCLLSEEPLVADMSQVPHEQRWSPISTLIGRMTLLDLPLSDSLRRILSRKLSEKPALEYIAIVLAKMSLTNASSGEALYLYDHICYRMYYFDSRLSRRLRIMAYRWMIRFPRIGLRIVEVAFGILARTRMVRGDELGLALISDRFARI